jgi:serine/threonine protein kinase
MIVFEFCSNGNLRDHLRRVRPSDQQPMGLPMETMLTFSHQIASGMAYLECKNVVHGDLAAYVSLFSALVAYLHSVAPFC